MPYTLHCTTQLIFTDDACAELAGAVAGLPAGPIFVVTDEGVARAGLSAPLVEALSAAGRSVTVFSAVPSNPGVEDVRAAYAAAAAAQPQAVVAIGGGSPMDV